MKYLNKYFNLLRYIGIGLLNFVAMAVHESAFRRFGLDEGNGCFQGHRVGYEFADVVQFGPVAVGAGSVRKVEGAAIHQGYYSVAGRVVALTSFDVHLFFVHES